MGWDQATPEDLEDWEDSRRRAEENPRRIGGAKWARELAALGLFYKIARQLGFVDSSPVLTHTVSTPDGGTTEVPDLEPTDVRGSNVKWLSPRGYRKWRDVGLAGMLPTGLENPGWPGRGVTSTWGAPVPWAR